MDKKHLHHVWRRMRPISLWFLLGLAVISGCISVYALRQNNLTMVRLRNQVFTADQQNGDVEGALRNLREFVYAHMNTNLDSGNSIRPPIQLKYRYERLVQAEKDRVSTINTKIYNDAQTICQQENPTGFSGRTRIPCVTDYVNTHGVKEQPIPDSLYKFDFVSPTWTPDLAGWSLFATALFLALFVVRYGLERWLKAELHDHV